MTHASEKEKREPASPEEAALDWHSLLHSGEAREEDRIAHEAWMQKDPANAAAYGALAAIWRKSGGLAGSPVVTEALRDARAVRAARAGAFSFRILAKRARLLFLASAGFAIAGAAGVAILYVDAPDARVASSGVLYRTAVGERKPVSLADGSVMTLNTATSVSVAFSDGERRITLLDGQAGFDVAHDPARPFVVYAGDSLVRAVGTEFDVFKSAASVRVTLIEGKVEVASVQKGAGAGLERIAAAAGLAKAPAVTAELAAGEQLTIRSGGAAPAQIVSADIERETAWREGRVSFKNTPLAEAVAEMNRYSRTKIRLADRALAHERISGSFRTGNVENFARALTGLLPVRVEERADKEILLHSETRSAG